MNASVGRQFYYHSDASPVGGHITHPFQQVVTTNASSSLAQAGGVVTANHDSFRLAPIVSADKAYSHISGAKNDKTGNWTTLTTSVVENLNVMEVVTADRIVGRLAVEHPAVGYTPKVSFVGVQFDNLRINGKRIHVKIDFKLLDDDHVDGGTGFPDRPFTRNDNFIKKVTEQSRRITEAEGAPEWLKARYGWMQSAEERDKRGYAICSLVEELGVEDGSGSVPYGHIIPVPEFGNLFLGELIADQSSFRLTMMRMELGCPAEGTLSFASADSNGVTMP